MLEVYRAYADFEKMADLIEELICNVAEKICGSLEIEHRDVEGKVVRTINLKRPWRRARYVDLVREVAGEGLVNIFREQQSPPSAGPVKIAKLPAPCRCVATPTL